MRVCPRHGSSPTGLDLYTRTAVAAAGQVIGQYSTSFAMACRMLPRDTRADIASIYALVRVADEVVDGTAGAAGLNPTPVRGALDELEAEVERAMSTGFSTNLVAHAFADVARRHGIDTELTAPFFASMRADLDVTEHDRESLQDYIYGSAEVVGLMCLQVFFALPGTRADTKGEREFLGESARRLGAAFQKVNFLRDLATDQCQLGRTYLPGSDQEQMDKATKDRLVTDLRADLDAALPGINALDRRARRAVMLAHQLFYELTDRIDSVPAEQLVQERISVPGAVKARLAVQVLAGQWRNV